MAEDCGWVESGLDSRTRAEVVAVVDARNGIACLGEAYIGLNRSVCHSASDLPVCSRVSHSAVYFDPPPGAERICLADSQSLAWRRSLQVLLEQSGHLLRRTPA